MLFFSCHKVCYDLKTCKYQLHKNKGLLHDALGDNTAEALKTILSNCLPKGKVT